MAPLCEVSTKGILPTGHYQSIEIQASGRQHRILWAFSWSREVLSGRRSYLCIQSHIGKDRLSEFKPRAVSAVCRVDNAASLSLTKVKDNFGQIDRIGGTPPLIVHHVKRTSRGRKLQ